MAGGGRSCNAVPPSSMGLQNEEEAYKTTGSFTYIFCTLIHVDEIPHRGDHRTQAVEDRTGQTWSLVKELAEKPKKPLFSITS